MGRKSGRKAFPQFRFAIDRGGTFTDVVATVELADGTVEITTCKLLSRNPTSYPDAPSEGIRRVMGKYASTVTSPSPHPLIDESHLAEIRMGTTVATNALLERNGVRSALVVTRGFQDLLVIGNQARPKIFDLNIVKNKPLYEHVVEVSERVRVVRNEEREAHGGDGNGAAWVETGTGHIVEVITPLDEGELRMQLEGVFNKGIDSVAISLMHAYAYPHHELAASRIAKSIGFKNISVSHNLMPMVKYVPRTTTASVDAYLSPLITSYISNFRQHFSNNLQTVNLLFIQSDGALARADDFFGYRAVLSGPAGGVVGCAACTTHDLGPDVRMVGFDMGGTSTDVCRCEGTRVSHVLEAEIAGTTLQAPQVEVHTVAAGGGSILKWENGMYVVGPDSAGAVPGPACYGHGGPLTVTDANLVLGRIRPEFFPATFGPNATDQLRAELSMAKFAELQHVIQRDTGVERSVEEIAESFVHIANETMCRAIRNITESKGFRCAEHVLTVFGGAGGQHACSVARNLGISRVYVNKYASFLSAVGASLTDVVVDKSKACLLRASDASDVAVANAHLVELASTASEELHNAHGGSEGVDGSIARVEVEYVYSMRFDGTSTALGVASTSPSSSVSIVARFKEVYQAQFGFLLQNRQILIDDVKVRVRGVSSFAASSALGTTPSVFSPPYSTRREGLGDARLSPSRRNVTGRGYFGGAFAETELVEWRGDMFVTEDDPSATSPTLIRGPAIICGHDTTVVVEPNCVAYLTDNGNMVIHTDCIVEKLSTEMHPLALSIFSQRFMSIAEQMGYALQRTSISTNIKERLDFSCAIFDNDGQLVANAPHIPVHLGAMGAAVRWQRDFYGADWNEGDVMVSNHPQAGGSHLPDITVMTPCWHNNKAMFYVASRGHHADVGGSTPGSMPPFSTSLQAEGVPIKTYRLVQGGVFQEDGIRDVLSGKSINVTGHVAQGCRSIEDNLSDLKAQVAANHRGVELVKSLIDVYGIEVVMAYMKHIQTAAEGAARRVLKSVADRYGAYLQAEDFMDDGTKIKLAVTISKETGDAVFDFSGTGCQVMGSTNCPTAVVHSAIIYCIRCLVSSDIPLNQGCMAPVTVHVPPASILAPEEDCAVVAGNVLTSQRVTDVIFAALRASACSQGCMNNFTMGNATFGYYETVCGGMGAGDGYDGASAVQCHMTNTRITDPEIFELRYPVLLRQFSVRRGTGGAGAFRGGDGAVRSMLFLEPMTVCLLSERRSMAPRGLLGGSDGARGRNMLLMQTANVHELAPGAMLRRCSPEDLLWTDGGDEEQRSHEKQDRGIFSTRSLGGKNVVQVRRGDVITVHTPGGGGFGELPS